MIKLFIKHTMLEKAIEGFFDRLTSNFNTQLNDNIYWKVIAQIDWIGHMCSIQVCRDLSKELFTPNELNNTLKFVESKSKELKWKVIDQFEDKDDIICLSDDGYKALCSHIVGAGKDVYMDVYKNPELAKHYVTSIAYLDTFDEVFK